MKSLLAFLASLTLAILFGLFLLRVANSPETFAQQAPTQVSIFAQAAQGITGGSATATGQGGGASLYYYVVARFPSGLAYPQNGAIVARNTPGESNLSVTNPVVVSWQGAAGATGYDVLRRSSPATPSEPCNACTVALNVSGSSVTDTGGNVGAYPPAGLSGVSNVTGTMTIDNQSQAFPQLRWSLLGGTLFGLIRGIPIAGQVPVFNTDGTMTSSAITGAPGPTGATGATGATGSAGAPGGIGATGVTGASGPSGPSGASGAAGPNATSGVFASLPSCSTSGQLYLFTNSWYTQAFCNGSSWLYLLNGQSLVPPDVAATFNTVNLGAGSFSSANGPGVLFAASDASFSVKARVTAKPGTSTWHVILAFQAITSSVTNSMAGICTRDSVSGKIDILGQYQGGGGLVGFAMTNPTTFSGTTFYNGTTTLQTGSGISPITIWLRVGNGGGNRTWDYSPDQGTTWINLVTEASGTRLTEDQVGFFTNGANTQIIGLHWQVTT